MMQDDAGLVEVIARAIYDLDPGYDDQPWSYHGPDTFARQVCLAQARAALTAIEAAGFKVVPGEPTHAMLDAAMINDPCWSTNALPRIKTAYQNMLAAAPKHG